jgi:hypothetical protein
MRRTIFSWSVLIGLGISTLWAAPSQREMTVIVVNAYVNPAQPVHEVRVTISYLENGRLIVPAKDVTNRNGQVKLSLPAVAVQSGTLRIEIAGAGDLRVYQPADGQLSGQPASLPLQLLPKGSPLLVNAPAQIEALLRRLSYQNKLLSRENRGLKGELAAEQGRKPDLSEAIAEWASENGFSPADVDTRCAPAVSSRSRDRDSRIMRGHNW